MARRKTAYLSDGSDSDASGSHSDDAYNSQEDADSRAERALFEYNGSKRRKMARGGKEAAWEGIFGEDDDQGGRNNRGLGAGGSRGGKKGHGSRTDITKVPTFVSGDKTRLQSGNDEQLDTKDVDIDMVGSESDNESTSSSGSNLSPSAAPSPRIRDEEEDEEEPTHMGLGGSRFRGAGGSSLEGRDPGARGAIGNSTGMSGSSFAKAGIGARHSAPADENEDNISPSVDETPPLSEQERSRRTFKGREQASAPVKATPLTSTEARHFQNISGTYGAKLLQKFGWNAGEGLGKDKSGRAVPVDAGRHLGGKGISSGIRSEDSKREARRRGEVVSEDEEESEKRDKRGRQRATKAPKGQEQSWRKQKKVKVKVQHKTYEQLVAEAGDTSAAGIGLVLDARGGEMREVESLSALDLSGWTPTGENAQIPELRHNLRLVVDVTKSEVEALAREGRAVNEKTRWALREQDLARRKVNEGNLIVNKLEQIQEIIEEITSVAATQATKANPSLLPLSGLFARLLEQHKEDYTALDLDDVVVGAIAQITRPMFAAWEPFDVSSDVLLSTLIPWRHAFRLSSSNADDNQHQGRGMTAWESLLWSLWLPKVRSTINNEWSASHPHSATHLLEAWNTILPPFILDNVLDQLILPKVKRAMDEWDGRPSRSGKTRSLSGIIFPWLPLLGHRMEDVLDGAKRRIRHVLRKWVVRDGVPDELVKWRKDIFSSKEWDELMLRSVVPKLGVSLRDDFQVNPRKQDMVPLKDWVLPWFDLLRSSTFSQLLEVNFFPKWLDILYIWLVQPNFKADEVANWFTWWKNQFPERVQLQPGVAHGFASGLELMQEAMRLGDEAPTKLRKPVFEPLKPSKEKTVKPIPVRKPEPPSTDITFRTLAEDVAAQSDLIFLPVGRSHDRSGKPLFKVSRGADGRGGITVYIGEDAVFAQGDDGQYRAVSLEDMVKRALSS